MSSCRPRCGGDDRNSVRPMEIGGAGCEVNGGEGMKDCVDCDSDEEQESGKRATVKMNDPSMPSKAEREEHEKTHLPYRSWCRHCVLGRGKELPTGHAKRRATGTR